MIANRSFGATTSFRLSQPGGIFLVLVYTAVLIYGSLVPLNYQPISFDEALVKFREIRDFDLGVVNRADWLANLFLYIPLGFMATVVACRRGKSLVWRILATLAMALAGTALAFAVEFAQLWFPPRTVSQNDLRAETIGSFVGALIGLCAVFWSTGIRHRMDQVGSKLLSRWGTIYLVGLLVYSLLPGDFVMNQQEFLEKWELGRIQGTPFAGMTLGLRSGLKIILQVACYIPIGYLAAEKWQRGSDERSLLSLAFHSAFWGACFALLIEVLQLPIYSRDTSSTAVIVSMFGAALGGVLHGLKNQAARRPAWIVGLIDAGRTKSFWVTATLLYSMIVLVVLLAPFDSITDTEQMAARWDGLFQVPFAALYRSSEFGALTNILQKGVIFAILGALHFMSWHRPSGRIRFPFLAFMFTLIYAALLGSAVEVTQVFIDSYLPDFTDVLIYTAFAGVGFQLASLFFRPAMCGSIAIHD